MSALEDIIKSQIAQNGPMDMGAFMGLALGHPEHGYYNTRDPFGVDGDFVTAPEISQMFGELVGVWVADCWMRLGSPARFVLLEAGPGRGTLMADALRATRKVDGFHEAAEVHLLEMSPVLKAVQARALDGVDVAGRVIWHESLESVPQDVPMIVIANEFFDALAVRQLIYQGGGWHERVVGIEGDALVFGLRACPMALWPQFGKPREGDVFEFSPARENFMIALAARVKSQNGAGLVIDYGHMRSGFGDTVQGVSKHKFEDVLNHIGGIDITSHVDFEVLGDVCESQGVSYSWATQGEFLRSIGIEMRAAALKQTGKQAGGEAMEEAIEKDLQRLVGADQMGELFKVMGVYHGIESGIAGF